MIHRLSFHNQPINGWLLHAYFHSPVEIPVCIFPSWNYEPFVYAPDNFRRNEKRNLSLCEKHRIWNIFFRSVRAESLSPCSTRLSSKEKISFDLFYWHFNSIVLRGRMSRRKAAKDVKHNPRATRMKNKKIFYT